MHIFYAMNGHRLMGDQIEMADFVIEVADTHLPLEKMSEWLGAHTRSGARSRRSSLGSAAEISGSTQMRV
ncbi:hypothetical protein NKG05_02680 [Oerskovia sp. M15]